MEVQSNENSNANASPSNVELTLFGIDKKWVRSNGSWVDKSKLPVVEAKSFDHFAEEGAEEGQNSSPWWQFWKA